MRRSQDGQAIGRRNFLRAAVGSAGAVALPLAAAGNPETLVGELYRSLSGEQRKVVHFPFDHSLRSKIDANWHVTPARVASFFDLKQRAVIAEIFKGLHNPDFLDKVLYHLREDAGGLGNYSVALFGEPGTGAFEFVLTGRHCTVRCDGDSVEGTAFGGPIFYGHASQGFNEKPDHPGNVYWYQAKRANELFRALDSGQREQALLADPRREQGTATVVLKSQADPIPGLGARELTSDQKALLGQVMDDLLLPFRERDRREARELIEAGGGYDALHLSFYKNHDIGDDGVWDVWQIESPNLLWYFRGAPHVHTWVHIKA